MYYASGDLSSICLFIYLSVHLFCECRHGNGTFYRSIMPMEGDLYEGGWRDDVQDTHTYDDVTRLYDDVTRLYDDVTRLYDLQDTHTCIHVYTGTETARSIRLYDLQDTHTHVYMYIQARKRHVLLCQW